MPLLTEEDIPELPSLTSAERLSWDYQTQSAARVHPITLARRSLNDLQVQPIESVSRLVPALDGQSGPVVTLAGLVIVRQKPPTAKGFMFLSIEDETGFVQCIVHPKLLERLYDVLVLPTLIVRGELQATGTWRALLLREAWPLEGIFGGYTGFASASGGQTRLVSEPQGTGTGGPELDEVDEVSPPPSPQALPKAV
jgi:error-prone DNA polymerase